MVDPPGGYNPNLGRRREDIEHDQEQRLTEDDIRRLVGSFDDIRNTLRDADSKDKSNIYRELRLALTYDPGKDKISVEAKPDADYCGVTVRVRGVIDTATPPSARTDNDVMIDYRR